MLFVGHAKIFVRKTSYLHFLLNSLRPEIRNVILRHFSWRITKTEIKSKHNSGFLEKFLEEGRGASFTQLRVIYRNEVGQQDLVPHCSNHCSNGVKNSNTNAIRNISNSTRAQELGEAVLECTKSVPAPAISIENHVRLDFMVLEVANLRLHSYDPVYLVVKPFQHTSDDILAGQDNSLLEDDVISRENFKVTFLSGGGDSASPHDENDVMLHCSSLHELNKQTSSQKAWETPEIPKEGPSHQELGNRPSNEKLDRVFNRLKQILPKFFVQPHDFSIYHPDVVFENNIRGLTTVGIAAYVKQLAVVRIIAHLKFAHVRMEVLKITQHPEDCTVRVRWRIRGISGLKVFLKIWKVRFWNWRELLNQEADWYDGFSIFYVGGNGLVTRHVCDRMMPDEEKEVNMAKGLLATKLAFLLGLSQRPFLENLDAMAIMLLKLEEINYSGRPVTK